MTTPRLHLQRTTRFVVFNLVSQPSLDTPPAHDVDGLFDYLTAKVTYDISREASRDERAGFTKEQNDNLTYGEVSY